MLRGGKHEGRQLLSRAWVEAATSTHSITPLSTGAFNYGYQIWVGRDKDEFLFNGMLGQNVWVLPREDLVVAMTAGNNELFQESAALNLIRSYFKGRRELVEASSVGYRELVRAEAEKTGEDGKPVGMGALVHPIRVAVSGRTEGPGLFEMLALLGRDRVVRRLRAAAEL